MPSGWADAVGDPAKVAERCSQTAQTGVQKSLQQMATLAARDRRTREASDNIKRALSGKFLPALFGIESVSNTKQELACPVSPSHPNNCGKVELESTHVGSARGHQMAALCGRADFRSADHASIVARGKAETCTRIQEAHEKSLETP